MTANKILLYICERDMKRYSMHTPQKKQYGYSLLDEHCICWAFRGHPHEALVQKQVAVIHLQVSEKSYLHKL